MPVKSRKNAVRRKKTVRARRSARVLKTTPLSREMGVGAAALGILGVIVLVMMVAARPHARTVDATESGTRSGAAAASSALVDEATAPAAALAEADAPTAKDVGTVTAPVTITGCLERSDASFRLKDTEGEDAPRTRSWKSGFLRKGPAAIQVVDAANRLKLTDHVGQRVSVTGTLIDREMRIRSLHRVASSCGGQKTKV